ncbi:hypothetical protein SCUCBS95973_001045 [Sporothrix curviconia]|uniref:Uncharacterized protein n=1 Tax=Sporothrix curviconia TaxID=1260050 RepID=A0ABP0AV92_9PEZI
MWPRSLLFAEPSADVAPPMWYRPQSGGQLISLNPVVSDTPMWRRPLARTADAVPIFEEAVVSPSHMWHRAPTGMPMCPCCTSPTPTGLAMAERAEAALAMPPRSPVYMRPSTMATSTSRGSSESAFSVSTTESTRRGGARQLQLHVSSLSVSIKRSFARLRGRSSIESL